VYSERFKNRVAVITGGASGVGQAIGVRIAAEGGKVSLWDRDAAMLAKAAATVGGGAHTVQVDVTDAAKLASAAQEVADEFGRIAQVSRDRLQSCGSTRWRNGAG
jgi:3-oxoacyl-[acyl-carrier protein] reductase